MKYEIEGIGIVSKIGAINKKRISEIENKTVETGSFKTDLSELKTFVNPRKLRRIAKINQGAILAALLAKEDCVENINPERTGLLLWSIDGPIQTTVDFLDQIIEEGDISASPTLFSNSVHNSLSAQVSIELELRGPNMTIAGTGDFSKKILPILPLLFSNKIDNLFIIYCEEINTLKKEGSGEGVVAFLIKKETGRYGEFDYDKIPKDSFNIKWGNFRNSGLFEYAYEKIKG